MVVTRVSVASGQWSHEWPTLCLERRRDDARQADRCLPARSTARPCGTASPMTTAMHGIQRALCKAKEALPSAMSSGPCV